MSKKRQSSIRSILRADTIKAYGAAPSQENQDYKSFVRCALTGEFSRAYCVNVVHIVPHSLGEELACYIFGAGQGLRMNRPENCLMMNREIEDAFGNGSITLFPVDPTARPVLRWKIILVNQDARNQVLDMKTVDRVGDLDGKEITFLTEQRPASRFLYYHFVMSLLLCRARGNSGWGELWLQYGKTELWSPPGRYLRRSMLAALTRCVGIVDGDFVKVVNDHSFSSATGLNGEEEDEIARRIVEFFEENSSQDEEDEAMEEEELDDTIDESEDSESD
jgi:HNH endonuclease